MFIAGLLQARPIAGWREPCSPPGSINIEFLTELHCLVSVIIFACHAFAPARAGWLDSGPIKYASILEK